MEDLPGPGADETMPDNVIMADEEPFGQVIGSGEKDGADLPTRPF